MSADIEFGRELSLLLVHITRMATACRKQNANRRYEAAAAGKAPPSVMPIGLRSLAVCLTAATHLAEHMVRGTPEDIAVAAEILKTRYSHCRPLLVGVEDPNDLLNQFSVNEGLELVERVLERLRADQL